MGKGQNLLAKNEVFDNMVSILNVYISALFERRVFLATVFLAYANSRWGSSPEK